MPKFTKKHYDVIASAIADARKLVINTDVDDQSTIAAGVGMVELMLRLSFQEDNPQFDSARFADACIPRSVL